MSSGKAPVSHHSLFIGLGFRWEQKHTQRLHNCCRPEVAQYIHTVWFYRQARRLEKTCEPGISVKRRVRWRPLQCSHGQMSDCREDVVFHTGENALCIVSRLFFVGFVPFHRNGFKAFFRWRGGFFSNLLLHGIDILRQHFMDTVALLAGFGKRDLRIGTQCDAGFFSVEAIFEI